MKKLPDQVYVAWDNEDSAYDYLCCESDPINLTNGGKKDTVIAGIYNLQEMVEVKRAAHITPIPTPQQGGKKKK